MAKKWLSYDPPELHIQAPNKHTVIHNISFLVDHQSFTTIGTKIPMIHHPFVSYHETGGNAIISAEVLSELLKHARAGADHVNDHDLRTVHKSPQ